MSYICSKYVIIEFSEKMKYGLSDMLYSVFQYCQLLKQCWVIREIINIETIPILKEFITWFYFLVSPYMWPNPFQIRLPSKFSLFWNNSALHEYLHVSGWSIPNAIMLLKDIEHIQKVNDKKVKVLQLIKTYKLYNICFI